jgi:hypothetical protein
MVDRLDELEAADQNHLSIDSGKYMTIVSTADGKATA